MTLHVSSSYEHALQTAYWSIGPRGIRVDTAQLEYARRYVDAEINRNLGIASNQWGCPVFIGAANNPDEEDEEEAGDGGDTNGSDTTVLTGGAVNINATQGQYALLAKLKALGYDVPKITKKSAEGEYETKDSTGELALKKMLAENKFGYPGGDEAIRAVLQVRTLSKLKTGYLNARFVRRGDVAYLVCVYNVAGTVSGRRSSRRHPFGYGGNEQNLPKHGSIAHIFGKCLVPREGCVFLFVDQIQAEDWPVSALAENYQALKDLNSGVDRHSKLASLIFEIPIPSKSAPEWDEDKHDSYRFIGKKARHATNYDMEYPRFFDVLEEEKPPTFKFSFSLAVCKDILERVDRADPSIKGVFHKYVRDTLSRSRVLITPEPFLRERQFLSIRPTEGGHSQKIKEAFAHIPQSTVADNTGFALLELETRYPPEERRIVQEGHDSLVQDIPDTYDAVYEALLRTDLAFDRKIRFHNGIEIKIPIEAEVGYSFAEKVKIKSFTLQGVKAAMDLLRDKTKKVSKAQISLSL